MTTLTDALKTAFVSYSTNHLREIGRYTKDRTVRATAYVLVSQFLRHTSSNTVFAKCIDRLRSTKAPLHVIDLTPDQDGWKEAMFELAQWADNQPTTESLTKRLEQSRDLLNQALDELRLTGGSVELRDRIIDHLGEFTL